MEYHNELKAQRNKVNNFIEKLFKTEDIIQTIFYHLNLFIENYKDKMKTIEHLNIILVGPAGAGKSTLINAILNVNAPEGFGAPVTQIEEYFSSDEILFLRLADSKGIEKCQLGVDKVFESIQDFIKKRIQEKIQINLYIVYGIVGLVQDWKAVKLNY